MTWFQLFHLQMPHPQMCFLRSNVLDVVWAKAFQLTPRLYPRDTVEVNEINLAGHSSSWGWQGYQQEGGVALSLKWFLHVLQIWCWRALAEFHETSSWELSHLWKGGVIHSPFSHEFDKIHLRSLSFCLLFVLPCEDFSSVLKDRCRNPNGDTNYARLFYCIFSILKLDFANGTIIRNLSKFRFARKSFICCRIQ